MWKKNHRAFSYLTLEACYWAGFIAADGCIMTKKKALLVCLSNKDRGHLEKLKSFLGFDGYLYQSKKTTNLSLQFYSKQVCLDLEKNFNITPRKSLTLLPPSNLTQEQILSYIIGYIDGDGSIGYNSRLYKGKRYSYLRLRIIGTMEILNWMNNIFEKQAKPIKHCRSKISIISFNDKMLLLKLKSFALINSLPILHRKWGIINL